MNLDYLNKFDIDEEKINLIRQKLNRETIENLEVMKLNVIEVLTYLKNIGITNFLDIILYRPDICFKRVEELEKDISLLDKELLLFIFNKSIDDLSNFNI